MIKSALNHPVTHRTAGVSTASMILKRQGIIIFNQRIIHSKKIIHNGRLFCQSDLRQKYQKVYIFFWEQILHLRYRMKVQKENCCIPTRQPVNGKMEGLLLKILKQTDMKNSVQIRQRNFHEHWHIVLESCTNTNQAHDYIFALLKMY